MVGREDMTSAVGLNAAVFNGSRIVGPALAGLLIGAFDISIAFLVNGLSYVAVIAAYLAMRPSELRPVPTIDRSTSVRGVVDSLAEGWRYVRTTPLVLLSVTVVGLVATFGMNFQVLIPPLADDVLNVGASGYGFLMAASGVGSTAAALYIAFSRKIGPRPIVIGAIALGLSSIVVALSTVYPLSLVAMVVVGAGAIGMAVTANTTIQLAVPDQLRGRVMSLYTTVFAGSVPAGGLLMGWLASTWGVPLALLVGALASLVVGLAAWPWLARIQRAQRRERLNRPEVVASAAGGAGDPRLTVARRR
jgi:MFS family permease